MGMRWPTRFVRGLIEKTARSDQLRNQTPSPPAAIVLGRTPVGMVATRRPVLGSMRDTLSSRLRAHTAPAPTAICGKPPLGGPWSSGLPLASGSLTVRVIAPVSGSMRRTRAVTPRY